MIMAENVLHIGCFSISNTDVVRICVIASLVVSSALITILAFHFKIGFITTQIFYIPIIYAASMYPKRGIIIAGICGVVFEGIGFFYNYPDTAALLAVIVKAGLFICVGSIIAYLIGTIKAKKVQYMDLHGGNITVKSTVNARSTFTIHIPKEVPRVT